MRTGQEYNVAKIDGTFTKHKITKLFSFSASSVRTSKRHRSATSSLLLVFPASPSAKASAMLKIRSRFLPSSLTIPPSLSSSTLTTPPFAGREGKFVTSRNLRDRLDKELLTNVSLKMQETGSPDSFKVLGRGELQLGILIEMMRREGFEMMVSRPEIVTKKIDDAVMEPVEHLSIDVPENFVGTVIERLGA